MPLRIRLVLILVLLVAVALGVIETITYVKVRTTLVSNVDSQMQSSVSKWSVYFLNLIPGGNPPTDRYFESIQPNTYAALYTTSGELVQFQDPPPGTGNPSVICTTAPPKGCPAQPKLSSSYLEQVARTQSQGQYSYSTVAGSDGVASFRVLATPIQGNSFVLVVAYPLSSVNSTAGRVLGLEILIGVLVLGAVATISWFLVRLGLRPLERMATTASEIAAGDLTKRVEDTDTRTEVGQLGAALNVMLTQIERAFTERQASEDQLRRFIADASHELRTPLTSIRGYAELFKNGVADRPEDLAAALGRIESESVRMGGLVDDLLLLARLDQGRPLNLDPVDVTQLAADAVRDASAVDQSRPIRLIADAPCYVIGDEERLRQVLGNLVSNALAYSPPGAPIEVVVHADPIEPAPAPAPAPGHEQHAGSPAAARAVDIDLAGGDGASGPDGAGGPDATGAGGRPLTPRDFVPVATASGATSVGGKPPWQGPHVAVAVVDHGPGIAPDDLPHVFERFWRADPSRQRSGGGNGLGLSIVAAVVAAHSGRVSIHETPDGGSTFLVELPGAPAGALPASPLSEVKSGADTALPGGEANGWRS